MGFVPEARTLEVLWEWKAGDLAPWERVADLWHVEKPERGEVARELERVTEKIDRIQAEFYKRIGRCQACSRIFLATKGGGQQRFCSSYCCNTVNMAAWRARRKAAENLGG